MLALARLRILAALAFSVLTLTGCFTTTPLINPMTLPLNGQYETATIKKAIQYAANEREWKITEKGEGAYAAELNLRSHYVKVDLTYNKSEVLAKYVDSRDMNYDGKNIHKKYHMWVDMLFRSIKESLKSQKTS